MDQPVQDGLADPGDGFPESPSYYFDFDAYYSGEPDDSTATPGQPDTAAAEPLAPLHPSGSEAAWDAMDEDQFDAFDELSQAGAAGSLTAGQLLDMAASATEPKAVAAASPVTEQPINEPYDLYALEAQVAAARSRYYSYNKPVPANGTAQTPPSSSSSSPSESLYQSPYGPLSATPGNARRRWDTAAPAAAPARPVPEKENWEAGWAEGMSRDRAIVQAGITAMHRRIREAGDCVITDYGQYMMLCEQQRAATDWHKIAVKETNMMQALYRGSLT